MADDADNGAGDGAGQDQQGKATADAAAEAAKAFTQADVDRIVGERLAREAAKNADRDQKAQEYDALLESTKSDQERLVESAKAEGKAEGHKEATPRIVQAEFRAEAKGVLNDEQTKTVIDDLELLWPKFVAADGTVDLAAIAAKVKALAPTAAQAEPPKRKPVDLGQGQRTGGVKGSAAERAAARAEKLGFKQPTTT